MRHAGLDRNRWRLALRRLRDGEAVRGTVKSLQPTFGFIKAEDGAELFFHNSDLVADDVELAVGDVVTFEVVEPQPAKGPRAAQVVWQEGKR